MEPNSARSEPLKPLPIDGSPLGLAAMDSNDDKKSCKNRIYNFVESTPVIIFMMIITLWALFGDDIRQVTVDVNGDFGFYVMTLICFGFFAIEIILSVISKPDYRWGFFFWLDVISTISLLIDVGFISQAIIDGGSASQPNTKHAASFAKTARASRIGTRAGRIVRIIRLLRLIRIVKLYKASQQAQDKNQKRKEKRRQANSNTGLAMNSLAPAGQVPSSVNVKSSIQDLSLIKRSPSNINSQLNQSDKEIANDGASMEMKSRQLSLHEKLSIRENDKNLIADYNELDEEDMFEETKVGKKLSDLTTKRVIILILSIMISIPAFSTDSYFADYTSYQSGIQNLLYLYNLDKNLDTNLPFKTAWRNYITFHSSEDQSTILRSISLQVNTGDDDNPKADTTNYVMAITNTTGILNQDPLDKLRDYEKKTVVEPEDTSTVGSYYVVAYFDQSKESDLNGYLGIGRTIFVCIVLTASAMFFSRDANDLVLTPIEKMLRKVKRISKNPLTAVQLEEEIDVLLDNIKTKEKEKKNKEDQENFETSILEKTIAKIGALLALGFGEAGSQIIANNLQPDGEINNMVAGKRVVAIFGYVEIKHFTALTETLQEGVMIFVNEMAEIIHGTVDQYSGSANKNMGDSFLFVWKFNPEDCSSNIENKLTVIKSPKTQALADLALLAFVNVQANVARSYKLQKYRTNQNLISRLNSGGNAEKVEMSLTFGLHMGWAIESAIGSEFKIDASYLSPHLDMANMLQELTRLYGVNILISEEVVDMVRDPLQGFLRTVDRIKVRLATDSLTVYTIDLDTSELTTLPHEEKELTGVEKKKARLALRNEKETRKKEFSSSSKQLSTLISNEKQLIKMRKTFTDNFYVEWDLGMAAYLKGDFHLAKVHFEKTEKMLEPKYTDILSRKLLVFMEDAQWSAPPDWELGRLVDDEHQGDF